MTQLAEIVVTTDQATLLGAAADVALRAHAGDEYIQLEEDEVTLLQQLVVFMAAVADRPQDFPVTGRMAKAVKALAKAPKGPAQPKGTNHSTRNKRKARQEGRLSFHKRRRKERREIAEQHNAAVKILEAEQAEAAEAQAEMQAKLDAEPKFELTDAMGNVIISGVPESMIRPVPPEPHDPDEKHTYQAEPVDIPKLVMPGSAEALETLSNRDS